MIVLSVSKIKLWKRCPQAYYYKYVEGIEPRLKAVPLERGGLLHEMLENYYTGKDWRMWNSTRMLVYLFVMIVVLFC